MRTSASDLYAFGDDVVLSGSTVVATAYLGSRWYEDKAVLIFEQRRDTWEEAYEIRFEGTGLSIALDGDTETLLISEPAAGAGGVVHMYRLNARGRWRPRGTFAPAGLPPGAAFGASVAIVGNRAVVGAPGADMAFVFERNTSSGPWRERAQLQAEATAAGFGATVALDGETALVSQSSGNGSVHVFVRESRSAWPRQAVLVSSDGKPGSGFGYSLDIDGNGVAVGAPDHRPDGAGWSGGAAYYYDLGILSEEFRFVDVDVKPGSDDNVPDLTLRYKMKDVSFTCGKHDLEVEVATVDDPVDYPGFARWYAGTLRITVTGC